MPIKSNLAFFQGGLAVKALVWQFSLILALFSKSGIKILKFEHRSYI